MALGIREAARLLRVSAQRVYRLIHKESLPAVKQGDRYQFDRVELEEWSVHKGSLIQTDRIPRARPSVRGALRHGGIHYGITASTRDEALEALSQLPGDRIRLTPQNLHSLLYEREELAPTTVGDGIALPYPRESGQGGIELECLHLCFFDKPVDFGALDGVPIHTALLMLSPDVESHLQLLARVSFSLRNAELLRRFRQRASADEVFAQLDVVMRLLEIRDRNR